MFVCLLVPWSCPDLNTLHWWLKNMTAYKTEFCYFIVEHRLTLVEHRLSKPMFFEHCCFVVILSFYSQQQRLQKSVLLKDKYVMSYPSMHLESKLLILLRVVVGWSRSHLLLSLSERDGVGQILYVHLQGVQKTTCIHILLLLCRFH